MNERILSCVECEAEIGPARSSGSGRQLELCRDCFEKNRKVSRRHNDHRRAEERRAAKGERR